MKKILTSLLGCLTAIIFCSSACSEIPPEAFSFIQISDPQLGFLNGNDNYAEDSLQLVRTVREINRLKPAFVVVTGDMTNASGNREQIECYKTIMSKISKEIPVYQIPGNHDIGSGSTDAKIDRYVANYGEDRFAFSYEGCSFVGINSCVIKDGNQEAEEAQFAWIDKTLADASEARAKFVFTHHSFFLSSYSEEEGYSNLNPQTRDKYWALFKTRKVNCVIAGHLHDNRTADFDGIGMITTGPVGKPLGKGYSGAMIWTIDSDANYYHEYLSVDELGNRDKLSR